MLNRTRPGASPDEAFTELDQYLLDELVPNNLPEIKQHLLRTTSRSLPIRWLSRSRTRSATGQHCDLERYVTTHRHRTGIMIGVQLVGIESQVIVYVLDPEAPPTLLVNLPALNRGVGCRQPAIAWFCRHFW